MGFLKEENDEAGFERDASSGLVVSGPVLRVARRRFSQAVARRDNNVPLVSKPFFKSQISQ